MPKQRWVIEKGNQKILSHLLRGRKESQDGRAYDHGCNSEIQWVPWKMYTSVFGTVPASYLCRTRKIYSTQLTQLLPTAWKKTKNAIRSWYMVVQIRCLFATFNMHTGTRFLNYYIRATGIYVIYCDLSTVSAPVSDVICRAISSPDLVDVIVASSTSNNRK